MSPRQSRWRDIQELDERAARFEQQQANLISEIAAAQDQLTAAREADRKTLGAWIADERGERPIPTVPGIEQRIIDLEAEVDPLTTATGDVLREKAEFVERHRGRLVKDAAKVRSRAIERLQAAITVVEEARAEAAGTVAVERWAREFPSEQADAASLRLERMRGGRLTRGLPDFKGLAVAAQVCEWLSRRRRLAQHRARAGAAEP